MKRELWVLDLFMSEIKERFLEGWENKTNVQQALCFHGFGGVPHGFEQVFRPSKSTTRFQA